MGRRAEEENLKQILHWARSPMVGSILQSWDQYQSQKQRLIAWVTVPPRHPDNIFMWDWPYLSDTKRALVILLVCGVSHHINLYWLIEQDSRLLMYMSWKWVVGVKYLAF